MKDGPRKFNSLLSNLRNQKRFSGARISKPQLRRSSPEFTQLVHQLDKSLWAARHSKKCCGVLLVEVDHFLELKKRFDPMTCALISARVDRILRETESTNHRVHSDDDKKLIQKIVRITESRFAVVVNGTDADVVGTAELIRRSVERMAGRVLDSSGKPTSNIHWRCTVSVGVATSSGFDEQEDLPRSETPPQTYSRNGKLLPNTNSLADKSQINSSVVVSSTDLDKNLPINSNSNSNSNPNSHSISNSAPGLTLNSAVLLNAAKEALNAGRKKGFNRVTAA